MSGFQHPDDSADGSNPDEVQVLWLDQQPSPERKSGHLKAIVVVAVAVVLVGVVAGVVLSSGSRFHEVARQSTPAPTIETVPGDPTTAAAQSPSSASASNASTTPVPTSSTPPTFSSTLAAVAPSLIQVVAVTCQGTGTGTGFWIDKNTVLTSYQSVSLAVSVAIVDQQGRPVPAAILGADPVHGVALLRPTKGAPGPVLQLGSVPSSLHDWLAVVGYRSRSDTVSLEDGQLSDTGIHFKHHDLQISDFQEMPGPLDLHLGGAPVVASDGTVEGIVFAVSAQNKRLVVPIDQVRAGVDHARDSGEPKAGRCDLPTGPYSQTRVSGQDSGAERRTLLTYFSGINSAEYEKAIKALSSGLSQSSISTEGWVSSYDFNIQVRAATSKRTAWVTFDSIFAAGRGPGNLSCARWSLDYTFKKVDDRLAIDRVRTHESGDKNSYVKC